MNENQMPPVYGDDKDILLQQYKVYVESVERSTKRRMDTNTLFISINALMVTVSALFNKGNLLALMLVCLAGLLFSVVWRFLLVNYNVINKAKWDIVYDMEDRLPAQPFHNEWPDDKKEDKKTAVKPKKATFLDMLVAFFTDVKDDKKYSSISELEGFLPRLFAILYALLLIYTICAAFGAVVNPTDISGSVAELHDALAKVNESLGDIARAGIGG